MHYDGSEKVIVGLELFDFLHSVVVKDSHFKIIAACQNPVLAAYEFGSPHWKGRCFESADACLSAKRNTLF